jgi:hypothetical protein
VTKAFRLSAYEIRQVAPGHGACFASDKVTVDGERVGYMYREEPDFEADSGWRFFSGSEAPEYVDDAGNFGIFDVNTIANYDADIIEHLEAPIGAAFVRDATSGRLRLDTG